jgi:hypothetical protein
MDSSVVDAHPLMVKAEERSGPVKEEDSAEEQAMLAEMARLGQAQLRAEADAASKQEQEDLKPLLTPVFALGTEYNHELIYTASESHIPVPPHPRDLAICSDSLLGAQDPAIWPQDLDPSSDLGYLCAIPARPTRPTEIDHHLLWNTIPAHRVNAHTDLSEPLFIADPSKGQDIHAFADRIERSYLVGGHQTPVLTRLLNLQRTGIASIQQPMPEKRLGLTWRHLQRTWLQIIAYVDYHSMRHLPDARVGAFVRDEETAHRLAERGIPAWVRRPVADARARGIVLQKEVAPRAAHEMGVKTDVLRGAPTMHVRPPYDTRSVMTAIDTMTEWLFRAPPSATPAISDGASGVKRARVKEEEGDNREPLRCDSSGCHLTDAAQWSNASKPSPETESDASVP